MLTGQNEERLQTAVSKLGEAVIPIRADVRSLKDLDVLAASVILNASAVNEKGAAMGSVYFATKAAVRSLARTLAAELAFRQIRVNAISPGFVPTNF